MAGITLGNGAIKVAVETHYRLVPATGISREDLLSYAARKPDPC